MTQGHSPPLQSVLDFIEQLTVPQIRKLYHVLSTLSFQQADTNTSMQDEMHTIIRKQLAHSEPKYMCVCVCVFTFYLDPFTLTLHSHWNTTF